ncbi:MAG: hypothetical protein A2W00_02950 [Candidatus Eisenbacteria bacterium RBG_16_71_46]|nr:MAG: hypothetical protein A2W00_02950 [Candidatus Eisenbacteria bacterium RBG_16_71_46]
MVATRHVNVKQGDVVLLVGTMKGAFLARSNGARRSWEVGGPYFPGHAIYALAYDAREGRQRLWASPQSEHWGATLSTSDDFGRTWTNSESAPIKFPEESGVALKRVWQIMPGRADQPQALYAGVEPAALFESRDGGATWSLNHGLWDHPHRARWQPGGGGLCLHTIIADPVRRGRLFVAVSTGGVYRSDDGGRNWRSANQGVRAEFLPDKYPEFGQCVHKIVQHPAHPDRLFLQNHWGLYRTENAGDSWEDIAHGVPSDFGFAMAMHPHDAETVYILPIESDMFRCTPEGKLRVYRTRNAGRSWEPLTRGLPQKNALETVLRDAMAADPLDPAGVYFGTRSGKVFGSPNGGAAWDVVIEGLPPVVCVKAAVVGDPRKVRVPKARAAGAAARPKRRGGAKAAARPKRRAAAPRRRAAGPAKKK